MLILLLFMLGFNCFLDYLDYLLDNHEPDIESHQSEELNLQTYQSKEIEELKKKYDKMDKKPVLYFDPYSDTVYICKAGEKTPLGDIRYLS